MNTVDNDKVKLQTLKQVCEIYNIIIIDVYIYGLYGEFISNSRKKVNLLRSNSIHKEI